MKNYQKAGSVGALILTLMFVVMFVYMVVQQTGGLVGPSNFDPTKVFNATFTVQMGYLFNPLFAIGVVLLVLGLYDRLRKDSPLLMQIVGLAGLGAGILFWTSGVLGSYMLPRLIYGYTQDPSVGVALRGVLNVPNGLSETAQSIVGCAVLLSGWVALQANSLPRRLGYLSLVLGAVWIFDFAAPDFLAPIGTVLGIIWTLWLRNIMGHESTSLKEPALAKA